MSTKDISRRNFILAELLGAGPADSINGCGILWQSSASWGTLPAGIRLPNGAPLEKLEPELNADWIELPIGVHPVLMQASQRFLRQAAVPTARLEFCWRA